LIIPSDSFLGTQKYEHFVTFREMKKVLIQVIDDKTKVILNQDFFRAFQAANQNYYEVYSLVGDYYKKTGNYNLACKEYRLSLRKTIPRESDKREIIKKLAACNLAVQGQTQQE
jgi:ribosome biogenesis protein Nip4